MAIQKTEAIVLNNRDFRETSLITTFYTRNFGKIKGLIKGIRGPKLRYGSRMEPFSFNTIVFYESRRSDFSIIAQCDRVHGFNSLPGDLEKTAYAGYLSELIDAVTCLGDANIALFELLFNSLELISGVDDIERIIRIFEIRLLDLSGFMPRLDCCVCCGEKIFTPRPQGKTPPRFSHSLGGLVCAGCFGEDKNALKVSLGTIASLGHIESIEWRRVKHFKMTTVIKGELKELLRYFLSLHLEKRFKSLFFLEKVRNYSRLNAE